MKLQYKWTVNADAMSRKYVSGEKEENLCVIYMYIYITLVRWSVRKLKLREVGSFTPPRKMCATSTQ